MIRRLCFVGAWLFLVAVTAVAGQVRIVPQEQFDNARMGGREAVMAVENNDQIAYYVAIDYNSSTVVLNSMGQGANIIPPGNVTYLLFDAGGTWNMVGDGTQTLQFAVEPGQTTTLMLEPFGAQGGTGLLAIAGQIPNRRSATLFSAAGQASGAFQPGATVGGAYPYPPQYPGGVVYPAPPPPGYEYRHDDNIGDMVTDIVGDVMDGIFDSRHDHYYRPHRRGDDGLEFHLNID